MASVLALLAGLAMLLAMPAGGQGERTAVVLSVDGAIGPATADYVSRGLRRAAEAGAPFVIVRMDTPGGLDASMRDIVREILASPIPVVTYVSPSGARAASAGTYILYASHVAAMTPGTNLGAATPVAIGGGGLPFGGQDEADENDGESDDAGRQSPRNAAEAKAVNDAVAYIRGLADLRGRNAEWAESAVREAASLSAGEALDENVIDIVARDMDELLSGMDGRTVTIAQGDIVLDSEGLSVEEMEPDWRTRLLAAITNPNVALILMMVGVYGLIFEFMNPGALYPGTIGAICLLVGLYALAALPVNFAGLGLMILGLALMVAEVFSPSFGILGIGGIIAFAIGATILIDTDVPEFAIAWPVVAGAAVASFVFTVLVGRFALTSHRRRVVTGQEQMMGARGEVRDWRGGRGHVFLHGERWRAVSRATLRKGDSVRVVALDGLTLEVEPEDGPRPPETP